MSENSKIEWCDHTFNPWVGCTPVSAACDYCYAERWAKRSGLVEWGNNPRHRTSPAYWRQPLKWNANARRFFDEHGRRQRVFCASLADVFDNQVSERWRNDLWELIAECRELDWLLLTKRPQNITKMLPVTDSHEPGYKPWNDEWPWPHVWLGTSAENEEEYRRRWPHLVSVRARILFVSYEPALGSLGNAIATHWTKPDWLICGGESGPHARPMHPEWARSVRDQCQAAGVPFFFKQWGEWAPGECAEFPVTRTERVACYFGGEWSYSKLTSLVSAETHVEDEPDVYRVGKSRAGRLLDGREHSEFPA